MAASASRPLPLRLRTDLEATSQIYQTRHYWVVKDPLTLKYYRFEEEEYALMHWIDGQRSPDEIKREFEYHFAPQKLTLQELYQFIGMLFRSSLLVSDQPFQGIELKKRGDKQSHQEKRQSWTNVLAIRFKGIDPDGMLTALNRWCGWIFSSAAFGCCLVLGLIAAGLIFTQFELFLAKLPSFQEFFAAKNWIWLALVLAITKVLHEFGHGLACKRFGSQCHEMGFMLLVLTPCLYVNVSDSWLLPNKWKRIFIAAAGMYVELILASLAVFVWWFSHPGIINQLALNVIFVCSVSTLMINANPLLRYDGYYILADWLEIPNLRAKASAIVTRTASQWMLGIEGRPDPFLPSRHRWLFAIYSLAAIAYRWVLTFTIFWFVYRVLEPYGLKIIGQLIAATLIYGLLIAPLVKFVKYLRVPGRLTTVKPVYAAVSAVTILVLLAGVMLLPIPHSVYCSFYFQPADAVNVYVEEEGRLEAILADANTYIDAGQPILRLSNYRLQIQLASLQTELAGAEAEQKNVQDSASFDPSTSFRLQNAKTSVAVAQTNFEKRKQDLERLNVIAPVSGWLIAPPKIEPQQTDSGELGTWSDTPLSRKNIGSFLERQSLVGQIVPDLKRLEAVLAIDQGDIEFIRDQQQVKLILNQLPGQAFDSTIAHVSPSKMNTVPKSLSSRHGGDIVVTSDKDGNDVPQSTRYFVKVHFESQGQTFLVGGTGIAKIDAGTITVGRRLWRLMKQTFHFEL